MEILKILLWGAAIIALLVPHLQQMAKEDLPKRNRYAILVFGAFVGLEHLLALILDPTAALEQFLKACQLFLPYCFGILMALVAHRMSSKQASDQERPVQQPSTSGSQPLGAPHLHP